jgi:hypothetical protein
VVGRKVEIMNLRTLFLSGVLASGLTLTVVPRVAADPPPWAHAWGHPTHADREHGYAAPHSWSYWNGHRDHDWNGPPYSWNHRNYRGNDARYSELAGRIDNDRAKIAEIGPTGRHRKALQWYRDDLRNAERDLHE